MNKSRLELDINGTKRYCLNDIYHREDGPAIIYYDGEMRWYIKGILHRTDGPAIIYTSGHQSWFLNGCKYKNQTEWFQHLTSEQQYNYLWNLG
jgi:hypothetical protein